MQHRQLHPASNPVQLELFPGRACPLKAKPATKRYETDRKSFRRDGVQGGGTRRRDVEITGETLFGPVEGDLFPQTGRETYKGGPRSRGPEAEQGVGGGHSTGERRENRREGRTAASTKRTKRGKAAGLPPRGKAQSRPKSDKRMDKVRKLQRTLYRVAKLQPERRFTLLYDKVCQPYVLDEAWRKVKRNGGAAGIDKVDIETVKDYGEQRFLDEIREELITGEYRAAKVRRVYIDKPGQPGRTRPLGIPIIKDRVVQMAVKLVIEPLFEADFLPCSYGFRPKRTPRMALTAILESLDAGFLYIVDVDLRSYFDTIDHEKLLELVQRRVADKRVLRIIRGWLKAGVLEDGEVRNPVRGTPQGGVVSPLLSNIFLHEVDRRWCKATGESRHVARLVRYADDMVLLSSSEATASKAWELLKGQFQELLLEVNQEKSRLTTAAGGFSFLGFEFRRKGHLTYMWPRAKAVKHVGNRVRQVVRSVPSTESVGVLVKTLNPVLIGWCTYFRVGNSNRVFHKVDWAVRSEVQLWLRRKHQTTWKKAQKEWNYTVLHERCGLYRMVGKVTHLEGLRRTPPEEGGRRAVYGKTVRTVR